MGGQCPTEPCDTFLQIQLAPQISLGFLGSVNSTLNMWLPEQWFLSVNNG